MSDANDAVQFLYKHGDFTYSAAYGVINKLCDNGFYISKADRIKELERERDEERSKRKMAEGLAGLSSIDIDGHSAMITLARDQVGKRMKAEAKLAKAMEALRKIGQCTHVDAFNSERTSYEAAIALAVLAELEKTE
jgi:hypothetical protein